MAGRNSPQITPTLEDGEMIVSQHPPSSSTVPSKLNEPDLNDQVSFPPLKSSLSIFSCPNRLHLQSHQHETSQSHSISITTQAKGDTRSNPKDAQQPQSSFLQAAQTKPESSQFISNLAFPIKQITLYQGKPSIAFNNQEKSELLAGLNFVLVGKFTHGRPPMSTIQNFFANLNLKGKFKLSLMDKKHVFIECYCKADFYYIWLKLRWSIGGFIMRILKWVPDFVTSKESSIAPVWISITNLPIYFFEVHTLLSIANVIGSPIQIDPKTVNRIDLGAARICVELDVAQPLIDSIWINLVGDSSKVLNGFWVNVSYAVVPAFCLECYHIGHDRDNCKRLMVEKNLDSTINESMATEEALNSGCVLDSGTVAAKGDQFGPDTVDRVEQSVSIVDVQQGNDEVLLPTVSVDTPQMNETAGLDALGEVAGPLGEVAGPMSSTQQLHASAQPFIPRKTKITQPSAADDRTEIAFQFVDQSPVVNQATDFAIVTEPLVSVEEQVAAKESKEQGAVPIEAVAAFVVNATADQVDVTAHQLAADLISTESHKVTNIASQTVNNVQEKPALVYQVWQVVKPTGPVVKDSKNKCNNQKIISTKNSFSALFSDAAVGTGAEAENVKSISTEATAANHNTALSDSKEPIPTASLAVTVSGKSNQPTSDPSTASEQVNQVSDVSPVVAESTPATENTIFSEVTRPHNSTTKQNFVSSTAVTAAGTAKVSSSARNTVLGCPVTHTEGVTTRSAAKKLTLKPTLTKENSTKDLVVPTKTKDKDKIRNYTAQEKEEIMQRIIASAFEEEEEDDEQHKPFIPPKPGTKDGHPAVTFKKSDLRRWVNRQRTRANKDKEQMCANGFPFDDKG